MRGQPRARPAYPYQAVAREAAVSTMVGVREDDGAPAELGARFGPYFALDLIDISAGPPAGWIMVADLADSATGTFGRRVRAVRAALAGGRSLPAEAIDERVAVSVAQLGLCARLVAPALAFAVLTGRSPSLDPRRLYWRDVLGGPFPLALGHPPDGTRGARPTAGGADRLTGEFAAGVLRPVVEPIVDAAARGYPVSRRVLWGNVASAMAGAAKMLGRAEPPLAAPAWRVVDELCGGGELGGGVGGPLRGAGGRVGPERFRRRSCCLIYRVAPTGARAVCEDCVLTDVPPPGRRT